MCIRDRTNEATKNLREPLQKGQTNPKDARQQQQQEKPQKKTGKDVYKRQGYFAVTKNVEQPFIVETNKCNVKVLGTEFNVMAYAADSVWETSLLEGAVEILVPGSNNSGMRLEPNMMASLKGNRLVKGRIKEADYFLWREGLLCFNDISVRDMIEKLKLYYGVDIVVNNTRILKNRYTGKFRTKDGVEHVLKVLKLNNKFTYTKNDETNVITIN